MATSDLHTDKQGNESVQLISGYMVKLGQNNQLYNQFKLFLLVKLRWWNTELQPWSSIFIDILTRSVTSLCIISFFLKLFLGENINLGKHINHHKLFHFLFMMIYMFTQINIPLFVIVINLNIIEISLISTRETQFLLVEALSSFQRVSLK